jgi:hypothetical protein
MLEAGGYVDGKHVPHIGRRNGTTYWEGAIMAEYTTRTGRRVTLRIGENGQYTLYAGSLIATVAPTVGTIADSKPWNVQLMIGVGAYCVVVFTSHRKACEFAKCIAEGLIKIPVGWFLSFDLLTKATTDVQNAVDLDRAKLLDENRSHLTILPEIERVTPDE